MVGSLLGGLGNLSACIVILLMLTGGEALEALAFQRVTGQLATLSQMLSSPPLTGRVCRSALPIHSAQSSVLDCDAYDTVPCTTDMSRDHNRHDSESVSDAAMLPCTLKTTH